MQSNIISCACVLCSSLMQAMCPNYKHRIPADQPFTEGLPWMAPYLLVCERQHEQGLQRKGVMRTICGQTGDTALCNMYGLNRNQSAICKAMFYQIEEEVVILSLNPTNVATVGKLSPRRSKSQSRPHTPTSYIYHDTPGCNTSLPPWQMCSQSPARVPSRELNSRQ